MKREEGEKEEQTRSCFSLSVRQCLSRKVTYAFPRGCSHYVQAPGREQMLWSTKKNKEREPQRLFSSWESQFFYLVPVTSSYKEQVNLRGNNVQCTMKFTSHLVVNPSKWSRYQTRKWKLVLYKVVEPVVTTNKAIQYSTWQVGFT